MNTLLPAPARKTATKVQETQEQLRAMALRLGPAAKLPTVTELKRELGVSLTTLDAVLKQLEQQNVIFRRQGSGIYVSPQVRQRCVGLVCEPAFFSAGTSPFWAQLVDNARQRAQDGGEAFRFYLALPSCDGTAVAHDLRDDVRAHRLQGVVFVGNNEPAVQWLEDNDIPTVVFAGRGSYKVAIDGEGMVRHAVLSLHARGCRRPALLLPWDYATEPQEKPLYSPEGRTFCAVLQQLGLRYHPDLLWETRTVHHRGITAPPTRQEQGFQAIAQLFGPGGEVPDSIICVDDMMTRGVLAGLRKMGLTPGHDLPVISHSNRGAAVLAGEEEGLSLMEVNPTEVVDSLFSQLELRMNGITPPSETVLVPTHPLF